MGVDYLKLRHLIITHPHEDHLCPEELLYRKKGFSRVSQNLNIYGGIKVFTKIMGTVGGSFGIMAPEDLHFTPFVLEHGQSVTQDDLTLLPLNAKHMPGGTPFCYVIERNGKKMYLYVINFGAYQTIPANCAVYKVSVYDYEDINVKLPGGITLGSTKADVDNYVKEEFDYYKGTSSHMYSYSDYDADYSVSINVDIESEKVSSFYVSRKIWNY